MDIPMHLGSLDPGIVKNILHHANDSLSELRLISPVWNTLTKEFVANHKLGALERVYLYTGLQDDSENEAVCYNVKSAQMVAILPNRHANNVGVGSWLSVYQTHDDDQIEVTCAAQSSTASKPPEPEPETKPANAEPGPEPGPEPEPAVGPGPDWLVALDVAVTITVSIIAFSVLGLNVVGVLALLAIIFHFYLCASEEKEKKPAIAPPPPPPPYNASDYRCRMRVEALNRKKENKQFPRLSRFVSMFDRIETLVLEDRGYLTSDDEFMGTVDSTLGDIVVNRLEVRQVRVDVQLVNHLVRFCRTHKVRHLYVTSYLFETNYFRQFAEEVSQMDVTVDLYEMEHGTFYFGKSRAFWDEMRENMANNDTLKLSLKLLSIDDRAWGDGGYNRRLRSHLRCEKATADLDPTEPLKAVETKRGFNLRSIFV